MPASMTEIRIEPTHELILKASAIPIEAARAWKVRSVTRPEDLIGTDLGRLVQNGVAPTGLLFPLRRFDGTVTYQLRLDTPEDDGQGGTRKYQQAAGTGAIINVPEMMADRVKTARRVAVVEGTKQTIAACLVAPDDMLVIGIQGCANFSHEGLPLNELREVLPGDGVEAIYVCFDADWKSNANVWAAADRLKAHYENGVGLGRGTVKLADLSSMGVGGKNGLDDWLGTYPPAERKAAFERLLALGKTSLGSKPAARKRTVVKGDANYRVDFERACIVRTVPVPDGKGGMTTKDEVALAAAAKIVESEAHVDEETGEPSAQRLTLEVSVRVDGVGDPVKNRVKVASSKLSDVGSWLDRLPHGLGVAIPRKSKPDDDIANAIRTVDSEIAMVTVIPHTGWVMDAAGTWRWCDGAGAIGPEDKIGDLRGEPASKDFQAIDLPAPGRLSEAKLIEHVRSFLNARELFQPAKRFSWDVAIAGWGLAFLGVTPNAAICWFGPPSSGKSTVAQALASSLNKEWAPRSGTAMSTFNARPAGMDLLPNGLSHCFLHVDDLKPESDPQSMKNALKAFDALLRRAHGSGGAVRGEIDRERDTLGVRKIDSAAPMMFITGEEIPSGGDGFAESGLDRALFIQVESMSMFGSNKNALTDLQERARSGRFRHATTSYLSWLAEQINSMQDPTIGAEPDDEDEPDDEGASRSDLPDTLEAEIRAARGRFDLWRSALEQRRQKLYSGEDDVPDVFEQGDDVSERAKMLAASLMLGWENVMSWAYEIGAMDWAEVESRSLDFVNCLRAQVLRHTRDVMGGNVTACEQALAALNNAISSQAVTLSVGDGAFRPRTPTSMPTNQQNKPVIGELRYDEALGGDVVIVNHAMAAKALMFSGGGRGLLRALSPVCILENGKPTRTLTINGARVQACAISFADFGVEAAPPLDTDH